MSDQHPTETLAPQVDDDGDAYVFVVLVKFAGGTHESPWSTHREEHQALESAKAQGGRATRVPYYDGIPREVPDAIGATPAEPASRTQWQWEGDGNSAWPVPAETAPAEPVLPDAARRVLQVAAEYVDAMGDCNYSDGGDDLFCDNEDCSYCDLARVVTQYDAKGDPPKAPELPSVGLRCILDDCTGNAIVFGLCPHHVGELVAAKLPALDQEAFDQELHALNVHVDADRLEGDPDNA